MYINLRHKTNLDAIIDSIADALELRRKVSACELNRYIDKWQVLVILDNVASLIKESETDFNDRINGILEKTSYPKFLIVT